MSVAGAWQLSGGDSRNVCSPPLGDGRLPTRSGHSEPAVPEPGSDSNERWSMSAFRHEA